ncbi:thymidine phosphorylase, partial [Candidatus Woesearchaeota archaeon]|nr:thymidine phosphorylase [Candidatus Woesearchaeota archaeon]
AGLKVPKTSSRAITSPSGTADTMEVLCKIEMSIRRLEKIVREVGGFLVWGGAEQINLAPADDKIIQVEHPLEIDAEGQMLASIMAKKSSVNATHLLLEMSVGKSAKLPDKKSAKRLMWYFDRIGKAFKIKIIYHIDDGSQPIGHGIGPALEARDVLLALMNDERAPQDLVKKSITMAGKMLEFTGKSRKGKGRELAKQLMENGEAYKTFLKIIKAQGGCVPTLEKIKLGKFTKTFKAKKSGKIIHVDNKITTKIARMAGAPSDHGSGIYLHVHKGYKVKKGDDLFTIYSQNKEELGYAIECAQTFSLMQIK